MNKQVQNSIQSSIGLMMMCVVATMALFFSSCKKKKDPIPIAKETFYTVTFDSKGGSAVAAIRVKKGSTITLPAEPTKTDFIFGGWYTDEEASVSPFSETTTITADITLYARWDVVFTLSSASFSNGGEIPPRHAFYKDGQPDRLNISPQFSWANAPEGTNSFLIIMTDLDKVTYHHWTVCNIPTSITSLEENGASSLPNRITEDYALVYIGPDPMGSDQSPTGEKHTYQFTIYALTLADNYFNDTNRPPRHKQEVEEQLKDYILGSSFITGTFQAK